MKLKKIENNKKEFLSLLLLADEQEDMVDRYLERGTMYVLEDPDVVGECVVTDEGDNVIEIKNLAIDPESQRQGYGEKMIELISDQYRGKYAILQVGTGDSPLTIPFYEHCGFVPHHVISNFFTDNYDHPIIDGGKLLVDMIILRKNL